MPSSRRPVRRLFSVLISLIVALALPRPVPAYQGLTLCQISEGIFGAKSGATKKAAALSFVNTAVSATDSLTGKNIVDPNKFQDGLGKVIDGVVACLNASVWANKA
jgi:flagellar biosynthesis protein FliR